MTHRRNAIRNGELIHSWSPVDLQTIVEAIQTGKVTGPVPTIMSRTDGVPLLYPGEVHSLAGVPESGKGWCALAATKDVIEKGNNVLYGDFEDGPVSVVTRMLAMRVDPATIVEHLVYVRPVDPFTPSALVNLIEHRKYELAVLDGVSEAYALLGLDPYNNPDAATFLGQLPRPLASQGAAVLQIDHVVKSKEARGRYALGAQHKLAGIAVAYSAEVITHPSRTSDGLIKIKVEKDRHGQVRGHANGGVIALMRIHPEQDGNQVTVTLDSPDATTTAGTFRPTVLMQKVSRLLEQQPGLGVKDIRSAIDSKAEHVDKAVQCLITEEHVRREPDGQTKRHYIITPFHDDGVPVSQPCPNRVPDNSVPVSHPYKGTPTGHPQKHPDGVPDNWTDEQLQAIHDRHPEMAK